MTNTLHKAERLNRNKVIEKMFAGGSCSFSLFPLRVVAMPAEGLDAPVSILVSVSKRRFKRAVKRNLVKRRIREAYRRQKQPLLEAVQRSGCGLAVAFIYVSDRVAESSLLDERMRVALSRLVEGLPAPVADASREEAGGQPC